MPDINTLVPDIQGLFQDGLVKLDSVRSRAFGERLGARISDRIEEEKQRATLRLSNIGKACQRQLWYSINTPQSAEPLSPEARLKFLYGDILEELLLYLAREAGHDVQYEQAEVDLYGVRGHIDGVIDGVLVDVKSASSASFAKFAAGLNVGTDAFGYLGQLDGYLHSDFGLSMVNEGAFLVVDKTLGKICLDKHPRSLVDYKKKVEELREMLSKPLPPPRYYTDEDFGKSGNRKLGVNCSYCSFRAKCWPNLRTFLYSTGPVFLTRVSRLPDVPEV